MSQCSAGNVVDAYVGEPCDVFPGDISGAFGLCTAVYHLDCFFHIIISHIVEHYDVCSGFESLAEHFQIFDFDFYPAYERCVFSGSLYSSSDASGCIDMVIFEHHTVRQIISVIVTAAGSYGIFFKNTVIRGCFSGVQGEGAR